MTEIENLYRSLEESHLRLKVLEVRESSAGTVDVVFRAVTPVERIELSIPQINVPILEYTNLPIIKISRINIGTLAY
jgi:hypothetical protein